MGGYLNYMYVFVCGNCLAKTLFFTFNRSVSNAQIFFAKYIFAMVPIKEYKKNLKVLHFALN